MFLKLLPKDQGPFSFAQMKRARLEFGERCELGSMEYRKKISKAKMAAFDHPTGSA
jgi:hypothetical protein